MFKYSDLIDLIITYCDENITQRIKAVANWKLASTENFLESMLKNRQDEIAAEFSHYYERKCDFELLEYAI